MRRSQKNEVEVIRRRSSLHWRLVAFVFLIMIIASALTLMIYGMMFYWFRRAPWMVALSVNPFLLMIFLFLGCILFGALLSGFLSRYYLRSLKSLARATQEVRKGNFKVRVEVDESGESEMERLIKSFNDMVGELEGTELFRNDFINDFSHEFKTPIVSIRGFARELQAGNLSEEKQREYATIIAEEADRLSRLSSDILELSKLENMQIVSGKTVFSLDEQIRQCILLQESAWSEKELDMIPELEEVSFYSNEALLSHVWTNLIGNAIKFTPKGNSVTVTLQKEEGFVLASVKDTGIGMSEEVMEHVFEKFYQGDPSRHGTGYGIGLTTVHRAVTLCGGEITVESREGEGSTFTVKLPIETPPKSE